MIYERGIIMHQQTKVTRFSTGLTSNAYNTNSAATLGVHYRNQKAAEQVLENVNRALDEEESYKQSNALLENVVQSAAFETQRYAKAQKVEENGRVLLFKNIMTDIVVEGSLLDDDFLEQNRHVLAEAVSEYIDERGGFSMVTEALKKHKTPWLQDLHDLCMETSRVVARRKLQTSKEDGLDKIEFEMDTEEKAKFDYGKDTLSPEQIASLVKDKTMTVIKDENNRQKKEEAVEEELEAHYAELKAAGKEAEIAKEQASMRVLKEQYVEESSLFNALQRSSFEEILAEKTQPQVITKESVLAGIKFHFREKALVAELTAVNPRETGNFMKMRPILLRMVQACKTKKEVMYLKKDAESGINFTPPDSMKHKDAFEAHRKWLKSSYLPVIEKRLKELDEVGTTKKLKESMIYHVCKLCENAGAAMSAALYAEDQDDDLNEYEDYDENADMDDVQDAMKNDEDLTLDQELARHRSTIDMDVVMAEALTKYGIMEAFHTTRLETFSSSTVRALTIDLLN